MSKKRVLLKRLPPLECVVCKRERPGGPEAPREYEWDAHVVDDVKFEDGYYLALTCSAECRRKVGKKERKC